MRTSAWMITAIIALLVAGVFLAGCSDESTKTGDSSSQPTITATVTSSGALYSEGDIVKNPKSTLNTGLLIIAYDAGSEMYERATIYPFSDGSWGYRTDSKTTKVSRATLEKVYTEKAGTITVSSVQIGAPTTVATTVTTQTTTAPVTTEPTMSTTAPKINDIDPFIGTAGTTVKITDLKGSNFVSGATVSLTKSGETTIDATDVSVSSATKITCKFVLPLSTEPGSWNVIVTNPDKQTYTSSNLFTIYKNTSATATATSTSTTTTTSATTVTITNMDPSAKSYGEITLPASNPFIITIYGTNLGAGSKVTFTQGSTTRTSTEYNMAGNEARIKIDLSSGLTVGYVTVTVYDSNNNILGSQANVFQIV